MIEIRTYQPGWGEAVESLQRRYIAANPRGSKFVSKDFYDRHPSMEGNVFCAFDPADVLLGYGVLYPSPASEDSEAEVCHTLWLYIRVDPAVEDWLSVQDALHRSIQQRAQVYANDWPGRRTRLAIGYPESRQEEIAYFAARGYEPKDVLLQMTRDLSGPIPEFPLPSGVTVRRWSLETQEERARYARAEAANFSHAARTEQEIAFYVESWKGGTPITAFDGAGRIAGSMMAYWYREPYGLTEDVFVQPAWRGQGLARYLLAEGLRYLREQGLELVYLEVRQSNVPAVNLYQSLGYQIWNREQQLELYL